MPSSQPNPNRRGLWLELAGIAMLAGLTIFFLAISWRKWCDPIIDFGDQLYTAWRLSEGAVLYRDVDLLYGPLSQYFNATLFAIFGPGIMVLVVANLIVFAAIVAALYLLCRRAWGVTAAIVACAIFISVFGFSQFVHFGNLNYATPYSHETTHGMLVCLLLCLVLVEWMESATPFRSFAAGALFGLTAVLKPEFMFAAGLMTLVVGLTRWRYQNFPGAGVAIVWIVGAIFPTVAFAVYLSWSMPWDVAFSAACRGWLNAVASTSFTGDVLQLGFLGLDQPWLHLKEHGVATLLACLVIAALALVVWLTEKIARPRLVFVACVLIATGLGWLAIFYIRWIEVGRCLLGLMSIYLCIGLVSLFRGNRDGQNFRVAFSRLLLALLATALMARMILNGRIYHYGYYQAALAAVILPAVLIGELPVWSRATWRGRTVAATGMLALLLPGVVILTKRSEAELRLKTIAVSAGRDQFFAFAPDLDPAGELVNTISDVLRKTSENPTLLVLPEGEMINYLARFRNPLPQFFFYAGVTADGREEEIVKALEGRPPYWVVIISRDLGEYGIDRYGEKPGSGQEILRWVGENYKQVAAIGGDPLDYREHGALVLRKYHYP